MILLFLSLVAGTSLWYVLFTVAKIFDKAVCSHLSTQISRIVELVHIDTNHIICPIQLVFLAHFKRYLVLVVFD